MKSTASIWVIGFFLGCQPGVAQVLAVEEVAGCYDLRVGDWTTSPGDAFDSFLFLPPPRVFFDTIPSEFPDYFQVRPAPDSRPSPHRHSIWRIEGDKVVGSWSTASSGVSVTLGREGQTLTGLATTFRDVRPSPTYEAPVVAEPVSCDTPPEYPLAESQLVLRSIPLSGGSTLELGKPLPESDAADRQPGQRSYRLPGVTVGLFEGGNHVKVGTTGEGLIHSISVEFPQEIGLETIAERFEVGMGSPGQTEPRVESSMRLWHDWMTSLLIMDMGSHIMVHLRDPRFR